MLEALPKGFEHMRAIRGATQISRNDAASIASAVEELCRALCRENRIPPSRIVSALFTLTPDLDADFPARAARASGWDAVPMMCAQEIPVPGALPRVCRVMLHAELRREPRHVYLHGAAALRPDLARPPVVRGTAARSAGRRR